MDGREDTMIRLHINELVLHGFDPRDRHAIADAVRLELARIIAGSPAKHAAPTHLRDVPSIARTVAREVHRSVAALRGGRP
jgi:hypothetical protein